MSLDQNKKVYCFGAGKMLYKYAEKNVNLHIDGIIDNYPNGKEFVLINNVEVPVISFADFSPNEDDEIIITSIYARDIINQIKKDNRYLNVKINVPEFLLDHIGLTKEKLFSHEVNYEDDLRYGKYQLYETISDGMIAGSKAQKDINTILSQIGYCTLPVHPTAEKKDGNNNWLWERSKRDYEAIYNRIENESIVVLQHPFRTQDESREKYLRLLKLEKNVKYISIIHDVEKIRELYVTPMLEREFDFMLEIADIFIVHNSIMKQYFIELGISESRVIELGIFDYLCDSPNSFKRSGKIENEVVCFAGNLQRDKSPFISNMSEIPEIKFYLYGPNFDSIDACANNVEYMGAYSSDFVPKVLKGGYGLVWDGDSLESCSGKTGNYLRYNNPHKLSLYLASCLPVIIWKDAACASFVKDQEVGILISGLNELPAILSHISSITYSKMFKNAVRISKDLRKGLYTKKAIKKAEEYIEKC